MDPDDLGPRLLELLGEPACIELLAVLELPEAECAAPIGALYRASADGCSPSSWPTSRPTRTTSCTYG